MLLTGQSISEFDPNSIPGMQLWLDATNTSSMTFSSGSNISQWNDKSGNALHFSNANTSQQPTFVAGNPSYVNIQSNANAGLYNSSSGLFNTTTWDMYCVIRLSTTGGQVGILSEYPGTNYIWCTTGSGPMYSLYVNGSWQLSPNSAPSSASEFQLYQLYSTGSQVGRRINAVFGGNGTDQYAGYSYPSRSGTRRIGLLNNSVAGQWQASAGLLISEIIVYDTALTDIQRSQVEGYLAWKWGLQSFLPASTHLFRSMKPFTRPFQPIDIDGCALWLDAADSSMITGSTTVTAWNDKSGNGRNLSVLAGTTSYSTYESRPSIKLNASSMYVYSDTDLTNYTLFYVGLQQNSVSNHTVFIGIPASSSQIDYNSSDGFGLYIDSAAYRFYGGLNANSSTNSISSSSANNIPLTIMSYTQSSVGVLSSYVNGVSGTTSAVTSSRTNTCKGFAIGGNGRFGSINQNPVCTANISEILVYKSVLTTLQRQQIEGYLAWKWGVNTQLPTTHVLYKVPAVSVLPFNPLGIPGCVVWSDAAPQTSVSSWTNLGSGGAVTSTGTINPAGRNGVRTVLLTTSQTWIMSTALNLAAYTMFWSGRQTGTNSRVLQSTTNNQLFGYWGGQKGTLYIDNNPGNLTGLSAGNTAWDTFSHSRVAGGAYTFNWNGTSLYSGSTSTANNLTGLAINTGNSPAEVSSVEIGEIIVFNSVLTTAQIQNVEGYLAWKWGMQGSLPFTHPYYKFVPSFQLYPVVVSTTPVNSYSNFLFTSFYNIVSDPSINGPGSSGWGSLIGTAGAYNPINFQDGDSRIGQSDFVGVISKGFMYSATPTVVTFRTVSDDGIALYFNGNLVLQNWTYHGDTINDSSSVTLPAGYTPIELRFFEWGGGFTCELYWSIGSTGSYTSDGTGVMFSQYIPPYPPLVYLSASSYSGSGTWNDLSPNGRNATIENGTAAKNAAGNGIVLDGSTNWIFPNVSAGNTWSFGLWYKSNGTPPGAACVLSQIYPGSTNTINMMMGYGGSFTVGFYNNGFYLSSAFSLASTWTNYQATWDGTTLKCYINGSLYDNRNQGGTAVDSGAQYRIGRRWDSADYVTGEFGEVRIFGSALTAAQVLYEYNSFSRLYL